MQEYLKRLFGRAQREIKVYEYPRYYEDELSGQLIKETADGKKYVVELDEDKKIKIIREL